MGLMEDELRWPAFRDYALCAGMPSDWFFTPDVFKDELGKDEKPPQERYLKGREVCKRCFVRNDCLEYALKHKVRVGIWGGKTSSQRQRIKRKKLDDGDSTATSL